MESRRPGFWSRANLVAMILIRSATVLAAFVAGYRAAGLAAALIASLALVVFLGPTAMLLSALRSDPEGGKTQKLMSLLLRVQMPAALALLVASIVTKMMSLIILCTFVTLMAGIGSLMIWAVRQGRE